MIKASVHFAVLVLVLFAVGTGTAQTCTRHVEPQGGFSICVPDDWTVRERAGAKFKVLRGKASDNFVPNINFQEDASTLSLSDYIAAETRQLLENREKIGADSIEPMGQSDFRTDEGKPGLRTIFHVMNKGRLVRMIQYVFDAGHNRKLIVNGTSLESAREVFDRVFDRAAKSIHFD